MSIVQKSKKCDKIFLYKNQTYIMPNSKGRPKKFNSSSPTHLIRVPEEYLDDVKTLINRLDSKTPLDEKSNSLKLKIEQLVQTYKSNLHPTSPRDIKVRKILRELEEILNSDV